MKVNDEFLRDIWYLNIARPKVQQKIDKIN